MSAGNAASVACGLPRGRYGIGPRRETRVTGCRRTPVGAEGSGSVRTRIGLLSALAILAVCRVGQAAEYYVAPRGEDASPGTKARPFRTLSKACQVAGPGDTVYLRAGTYCETLTPKHSGEPARPLRFVAMPGEKVVLSGADVLAGSWARYRDRTYALKTYRKFVQLFVDGKMMPEARWPNSRPEDLLTPSRAAAGEGTGYEVLADPKLPPGDWEGATVLIWPGQRWVSATRRVTNYEPGRRFRFDRSLQPKTPDPYHASDPYQPRAGNPYVLIGSLAGLDSPGEWYLDEKAGVVYLWPPNGDSPEVHRVEAKQRDYAVDLSGLGFVEVKGFDIIGAAVSMAESHDCLLEDCRLRYVDHFRDFGPDEAPPPKNVVTGKNNEWRRCLIAYSATTGLRLAGEGNRLVNSVVHDVDYSGDGRGGLDLDDSVGAQVLHCTLSATGRDIIQHGGSKRLRVEYNDLYSANMLNNDAAAIYCWRTDGQGGVIAHNWVHDNLGDDTVGIYLDNFSSNFIVHHNLIWNCSASGIRLNSDAKSHLVCNNTITDVREPFGTFTYEGYTPTMEGTRVINNLVNAAMNPRDPAQFVQGELGPELRNNAPGAIDRDGRPVAGSAAVDAGVTIPGLTTGYTGKAPDLGAYEYGGEHWVPGADWRDPQAASPPRHDLSYTPRGPVTARTMIRAGLVVWLDAADATTLEVGPDGAVRAWHGKSAGEHIARPVEPGEPVRLVADGLGGKPVVRGNGAGSLRIGDLKRGPGAMTALVVSQGLDATGPTWQRIIACFTGVGEEWVWPNWMVERRGGARPEAYPAQIFVVESKAEAALGRLTVLGASAIDGQYLAGDVAEVLVFDRTLRFDELEALQTYLRAKWGLAD